MAERTDTRGPKGQGSIYRRAGDNRWIAAWADPVLREMKRRRKTLSGKLFCEVLKRYSAARPVDPDQLGQPQTFKERLAKAREKGTHTEGAWNAHIRSVERRCAYCGRQTGTFTLTKDHRIPLSRGGSDGLDNLAVACRWCNFHKASMTDTEFMDYLDRTGLRNEITNQPLTVDYRWTRRGL